MKMGRAEQVPFTDLPSAASFHSASFALVIAE
jgi:hypothetical protein